MNTPSNKSASRIRLEEVLIKHDSDKGLTVDALVSMTGDGLPSVRKAIGSMRDAQMIVNIGTPKKPVYRIAKAKRKQVEQAPRQVFFPYVPHELKPYEGRPGAMDAYLMPSLRDGVRYPYIGPPPMIVTGKRVF